MLNVTLHTSCHYFESQFPSSVYQYADKYIFKRKRGKHLSNEIKINETD